MSESETPREPESAETPPPPPAPAAPVKEGERLLRLDMVRGIALMGILLVNILAFGLPHPAWITPGVWEGETALDRMVSNVISTLVLGKFYPLFTILFGIGLSMQYRRLRERSAPGSRPSLALLLRRLAWLAVIGLLHVVLFWEGDILFQYAIAGLVGVLFLGLTNRVVLWVAAIFFVLSAVCCMVPMAALSAFVETGEAVDPATFQMAKEYADNTPLELALKALEPLPESAAATAAVYIHGSWLEVMVFRTVLYIIYTLSMLLQLHLFLLVALVLFGFWLDRTGFFTTTWMAPDGFKWVMPACLPVGLAGSTALVYAFSGHPELAYYRFALNASVGVVMALGYLWVLRSIPWEALGRVVRAPLSAMGRMALSNYLLASVFFTTFFYGYGWGFYGRFQYTGLVVLAVGFWAVQMAFSLLWLHHFRFGPVEWAWRSLTYWKAQPLLRDGDREGT